MNKKILILSILLLLFSPILVQAKIITVYQSVDPVEIYSQVGTSTTMIFPAEIRIAIVGNPNAFQAEKDVNNEILIISPLRSGVWTNLTVIDQNNNQYVFKLIESNLDKYDIVNVRVKESIPYATIVKIIRDNHFNIDPNITKLVDLFDVEDVIVANEVVEVELKRAAIINNTDETVYWIRIKNITDNSIIINSVGLQERNLKAIVTQDNNIAPGNYGDYFLITQGRIRDKNLTINIKIFNSNYEIAFEEINYRSQSFNVYEINSY